MGDLGTAVELGHPDPDTWPEDTRLVSVDSEFQGHGFLVVCLQDESYGQECCAKAFAADEYVMYAGGSSFDHLARVEYGTLAQVCERWGAALADPVVRHKCEEVKAALAAAVEKHAEDGDVAAALGALAACAHVLAGLLAET